MTNEQKSKQDANQLTVYQIPIKGHLRQQWISWFDGLTIILGEAGNTLLNRPVIDQAALHGILRKVRDLGMILPSVNSFDVKQAAKAGIDKVDGDV